MKAFTLVLVLLVAVVAYASAMAVDPVKSGKVKSGGSGRNNGQNNVGGFSGNNNAGSNNGNNNIGGFSGNNNGGDAPVDWRQFLPAGISGGIGTQPRPKPLHPAPVKVTTTAAPKRRPKPRPAPKPLQPAPVKITTTTTTTTSKPRPVSRYQPVVMRKTTPRPVTTTTEKYTDSGEVDYDSYLNNERNKYWDSQKWGNTNYGSQYSWNNFGSQFKEGGRYHWKNYLPNTYSNNRWQ